MWYVSSFVSFVGSLMQDLRFSHWWSSGQGHVGLWQCGDMIGYNVSEDHGASIFKVK